MHRQNEIRRVFEAIAGLHRGFNGGPVAQRPCLLEFRQAIGAREASLRRDDCGDWAVSGTSGHVYAVAEGFQLGR
jgi:hypothetical protein